MHKPEPAMADASQFVDIAGAASYRREGAGRVESEGCRGNVHYSGHPVKVFVSGQQAGAIA